MARKSEVSIATRVNTMLGHILVALKTLCTCSNRTIHGYPDDRFHARESTPFGGRRKRGEQKQAVGRSRRRWWW